VSAELIKDGQNPNAQKPSLVPDEKV